MNRENIIFILLGVTANLTPLYNVISVNLVNIILLLIGQGSRTLLLIGWTYLLRRHI
jgi:hypothetical protein